jgi:hypothetical protein
MKTLKNLRYFRESSAFDDVVLQCGNEKDGSAAMNNLRTAIAASHLDLRLLTR